MARKTNDRDLTPVLAAAKYWIDRCLIGDQSLFFDEVLWTEANAAELQKYFVDNPDYSKGSFQEKLSVQLAPASPQAKQLMAEVYWAVQLFPVTPKSKKKREIFLEVWAICSHPLSQAHPMLQDPVLNGIGSAGTAYLTAVWREIVFLIRLLLKLKSLPEVERRALFSANQTLSPWLDALVDKGSRQFPHILRYFAFPGEIERISSAPDKKKILTGFGIAYDNRWTSFEVDQQLLALRQKQEALHPGEVLDFYDPPLVGTWKNEANDPTTPRDDAEVEPPSGSTLNNRTQARMALS
jgi:5-methylcytosine-specific restriction protein B